MFLVYLDRLKLADPTTHERFLEYTREICEEDPRGMWILQAVLQDAITAKGWGLQQEYVPYHHESRRYKAFVSVGPQNGDLKEGHGSSPARSLLEAYLEAIQ
jgi:hypothetical protein